MTTDIFVDNVLASVRTLIRQQCPMTRAAVDLLLADFENRFRDDLDRVIAYEVEEAKFWFSNENEDED
jgi:hypothetical protein